MQAGTDEWTESLNSLVYRLSTASVQLIPFARSRPPKIVPRCPSSARIRTGSFRFEEMLCLAIACHHRPFLRHSRQAYMRASRRYDLSILVIWTLAWSVLVYVGYIFESGGDWDDDRSQWERSNPDKLYDIVSKRFYLIRIVNVEPISAISTWSWRRLSMFWIEVKVWGTEQNVGLVDCQSNLSL